MLQHSHRELIGGARRIVVKVGSSSLTERGGGISPASTRRIVEALAHRAGTGTEIVLVSSGAIAAGLAPLNMPKRPKDLASQQAAATVGQGLLMHRYAELFSEHGLVAGQVLLTSGDLVRRTTYLNAHRVVEKLLHLGVVPIVNENDAVATQEIRFGDNDRLAALAAHLIKADALVLLSDVDAVYTDHPAKGGVRIPVIASAQEGADIRTDTAGSSVGTGGMATKIEAADIAAEAGVTALITSAALIEQALSGESVGTLFPARGPHQPVRRMWLAHLAPAQGAITVDPGAEQALRSGGVSLLTAGITGTRGEYDSGDVVDIFSADGECIARGFAAYSSREMPKLLGLTSSRARRELGEGYDRAAVHADDLVLMSRV